MTPEDLVALIIQKKWIALMALLLGFTVRLLKSDTKIPINIPPQYRVWLALGLAPIAGAFDKWAAGTTWTTAMVEGLIASVMAIVSHNVVVDSMRGGREFVVPGLIKPDVSPGPGKPPSIKPPPMMGMMLGVLFAILLAGCAYFTPKNIATAIDIGKELCVISHAFLNNAELDVACNLLTPQEKEAGHTLATGHREQLAKELKAMHAEACLPGDAGLDASDASRGGAK